MIFSDRASYLCLPLERVGLDSAADVVAINSSCECVRATVIEYLAAKDSPAQAILLEFVADVVEPKDNKSSEDQKYHPASLRVIFDVSLSNGESHKFSADLLHTKLIREVYL